MNIIYRIQDKKKDILTISQGKQLLSRGHFFAIAQIVIKYVHVFYYFVHHTESVVNNRVIELCI